MTLKPVKGYQKGEWKIYLFGAVCILLIITNTILLLIKASR